ncbi:MAG: hypothetical protein A3B10_01970 [Candidatus Doudnabacteria bacterium RIFCSPLOWO2_01_FULL_44_21]|uniref:Uncharacterized protein n=1 Tax=Candidatus Doudnabacteria bacterium RIFCSPLOWO2_01_FULL_44_21 TaxID=1817841 RepID=A0A1F5Q2M3_9BACT|nr:MAG: hypothetical protein A3B10_01970 [Candidatus Doudnabacteria bacterium RIFCSPLOWO2_01_FULL_44_21]
MLKSGQVDSFLFRFQRQWRRRCVMAKADFRFDGDPHGTLRFEDRGPNRKVMVFTALDKGSDIPVTVELNLSGQQIQALLTFGATAR